MKARVIIRSVIAAYLITGVLLFFTAFLLYKLEPKESLITLGILLIYILSCFLGGILAGKGIRTRRFLWGMMTGVLYFILLLAMSWIFGGGIQNSLSQILTTLVLCGAGGMLGGMFA